MNRFVSTLAPVLLPALLSACATQPAYQRPALDAPAAWSDAEAIAMPAVPLDRDGWWELLRDPAINQLVASGLRDSPTLAEAAARFDQARAVVKVQDAARTPTVGIEGGVSRSWDRARGGSGASSTTGETAASIGARLSWELDLWGRVRAGSAAAQHRLTARGADAEAARLSVVGEIVDTVLALRACQLTLELRDGDIASREIELRISRSQRDFGTIAPVAVAAAESNLASAQTDRITQDENCRLLVNALVALSGADAAAIRALISPNSAGAITADTARLPAPPPFAPALPATVLLAHPAVIAAEREAAARWSEIAVARAERLPRIDLIGVLTGQWISALGASSSWSSGSAGASLTAPLIDGGSGAARVRAAQAAYREAVAHLTLAVRSAVRDVEDGLAARQSAEARIETAAEALEAARFTLRANEARWRAGAIAQFELEEARRQFNRAQESTVVASADRARAWVALVRRTGSATNLGAAVSMVSDGVSPAGVRANASRKNLR